MRIYADKLSDQLNRQRHPVYLLFGNEPLLIQESHQAIRAKAQTEGFDERHRFTLDSNLNWNDVYDCCQALSLFSARQIIELEVTEAGLNAGHSKELVSLSAMLHPDILLIIIGGKLTKAQENAKWFKALNNQGCWVSCLTPDIQRLPQFVQSRCHALGLTADAEARQMLAQWHEGNLFALSQSLEKLALLYPDGQLTLVRLEESLSRHNHFTAFHWIDALLAGKAKRAQRILRQLEAESVEPVILVRSIQKELMLLLKLQVELKTASASQVFDKHRIWQSKRPLYNSALSRLSFVAIQQRLSLLAQCEILSKTQYDTSPWPILHQLSLELCQPSINLAAS
ncbi:DNA polymerase III subunit delta [Vibrio genomosp. F10 str. 9ZC157]|uniref:DNA polymerase III subunit delta n=1 Tax=Vibrio genomosp. F10 str. ZF-129 TaxID=1187848 RepID=A0A1E5BES9_9VIBR|nr:DNA polymerase III subunit delta [Vibrio genomosp. F10]OEE34204.1 DNA polymerase III subunit delta [Vibrio genomosp. F10 str. ZF-129]OEE97468.1 DNA polymerase III subunit delta [Vibrio genomosp. F10 str. 9ZC157]